MLFSYLPFLAQTLVPLRSTHHYWVDHSHNTHTHSFVGGMISGLVRGLNQDLAVKAGLRAAYLSVLSQSPVSKILTPDLFTEQSLRMWAPWSATML